jgi:uncharacterized protein DUF3551
VTAQSSNGRTDRLVEDVVSSTKETDMRIFPIFALAILGMLASTAPGRAEITYPWCAQYGGGGHHGGGGRNCGFWTYDQCMAALSGNGGYCGRNAMYRGPQPGMIPPPPGVARR